MAVQMGARCAARTVRNCALCATFSRANTHWQRQLLPENTPQLSVYTRPASWLARCCVPERPGTRCTATARILHAYCTARIPHSQTMDFGLWPAQAVRSSAHCRCHTYQDTKTGLWQAPDAGLARVEQRKHKRAQGYHGVHACHLFWYMVATICVHMTNALWPPICECKTEHGRETRHSQPVIRANGLHLQGEVLSIATTHSVCWLFMLPIRLFRPFRCSCPSPPRSPL